MTQFAGDDQFAFFGENCAGVKQAIRESDTLKPFSLKLVHLCNLAATSITRKASHPALGGCFIGLHDNRAAYKGCRQGCTVDQMLDMS